MKYKLRAFDGTYMWNISDYAVKPGGIELTAAPGGKTMSLADMEYVIISGEEKKNLLYSYADDNRYERIDRGNFAERINFRNDVPVIKPPRKKQSEQ